MNLELIDPTDQRLNEIAAKVSEDELQSSYVQSVIDRMLALAAGKGHSNNDTRQMVGLAAPQLGVGLRIIAIDLTADGSHNEQSMQVVINPQLTKVSVETMAGREGCWSAGDICGIVERAKAVTVEGVDREGAPLQLMLEGFVARIAQHEVDHLEGMRFPDRIPVDRPDRLHKVRPDEFQRYRIEWPDWPNKCDREVWLAMKAGRS